GAAVSALARLRERARTPLPRARLGEGLADSPRGGPSPFIPCGPLIHALSRQAGEGDPVSPSSRLRYLYACERATDFTISPRRPPAAYSPTPTRGSASAAVRAGRRGRPQRIRYRVRDHTAGGDDAAFARALGAERVDWRGMIFQHDGADLRKIAS